MDVRLKDNGVFCTSPGLLVGYHGAWAAENLTWLIFGYL